MSYQETCFLCREEEEVKEATEECFDCGGGVCDEHCCTCDACGNTLCDDCRPAHAEHGAHE
jgi:hypothetical protein